MESLFTASKFLGERIALRIPFLDLLDFSDEVDTVSVTVTTASGVDSAPEDLLYGSASYNSTDNFLYQQVEGGVAGCIYSVVATVEANGKVLQRRVILSVLESTLVEPPSP